LDILRVVCVGNDLRMIPSKRMTASAFVLRRN
jgi:hypothetical protein